MKLRSSVKSINWTSIIDNNILLDINSEVLLNYIERRVINNLINMSRTNIIQECDDIVSIIYINIRSKKYGIDSEGNFFIPANNNNYINKFFIDINIKYTIMNYISSLKSHVDIDSIEYSVGECDTYELDNTLQLLLNNLSEYQKNILYKVLKNDSSIKMEKQRLKDFIVANNLLELDTKFVKEFINKRYEKVNTKTQIQFEIILKEVN